MSLTQPIADLKKQLREKLIEEDLAETLHALLVNLPEGSEKHRQIVLLTGRLNQVNAERLEGLITNENLQVAYNQIRSSALDLIESLEDADFEAVAALPEAPPPADNTSVQGHVLYRVPHSMPLQQETRCVVRVAVQKGTIAGNIQLDDHVKVQGLMRVSELMEAELVDLAATPHFSIRTTSEPEQIVHPDGYTEWFFFVTPLHTGIYELQVKISVIELIYGKERKKEIALAQSVEVVAEGAVTEAGADEYKAAGVQFGLPNKAAAAAALAMAIRREKGAAPNAADSLWRSAAVRIAAAVAVIAAGILLVLRLAGPSDAPTAAAPPTPVADNTPAPDTGFAQTPPVALPDTTRIQATGDTAAAASVGAITAPTSSPTAPVQTPPPPAENAPGHPDMILVRGGAFEMGDIVGDRDRSDNPVHTISLADYYIAAKEVTFDEYDRYCQTARVAKPSDSGWGRGNRPVILVTWFDAVRYCNWLSKQFGYKPVYTIRGESVTANWAANGFRLPTEAEWEYAARARGKTVRYGNGVNTADPRVINFDANANYKERYSVVGDSRGKTTVVGSFAPNELGLYDMAGNVHEWCWDWYAADYYKRSPASNPRGPERGEYDNRVIRGGSWNNAPQSTRATFRDDNAPQAPQNHIGFRLARNAP